MLIVHMDSMNYVYMWTSKIILRVDTILIVQYQSTLYLSATGALHRMSTSTLDGKLSYAIQTHSNISLMRDSTST